MLFLALDQHSLKWWLSLQNIPPRTSKNVKRYAMRRNQVRATIQPSIDVTGIRSEIWQWRKNDAVILVSIGQSKLKLMSGNWIFYFSNSDLDLDHRHLNSNHKLRLDVSYPYSKFGVNRPKQTKVIERKPKVYARPTARPPAADFSITITRFSLKNLVYKKTTKSFLQLRGILCQVVTKWEFNKGLFLESLKSHIHFSSFRM